MRRPALMLSVASFIVACSEGATVQPDAGSTGSAPAATTNAPSSSSIAPLPSVAPLPSATVSAAPSASVAPTGGARCASFASAVCRKYEACLPSAFAQAFGAVAACQDRMRLECDARPAPLADAWSSAACTKVFAALTCEDFLDDVVPDACAPPPGSNPDGAACASDDECASRWCVEGDPGQGKSAPGCGVCKARGKKGEACEASVSLHPMSRSLGFFNAEARAHGGCSTGLRCDGASKKCGPSVAAGAKCKSDAVCTGDSVCAPKKQVCTAPGGVGAKCGGKGDPPCDRADLLSCVSGACAAPTFAPFGAACDSKKNLLCEGGGTCDEDVVGMGTSLVTKPGTHRCKPPIADGAAVGLGETCLLPARRVEKKCALPAHIDCH